MAQPIQIPFTNDVSPHHFAQLPPSPPPPYSRELPQSGFVPPNFYYKKKALSSIGVFWIGMNLILTLVVYVWMPPTTENEDIDESEAHKKTFLIALGVLSSYDCIITILGLSATIKEHFRLLIVYIILNLLSLIGTSIQATMEPSIGILWIKPAFALLFLVLSVIFLGDLAKIRRHHRQANLVNLSYLR